MYATLNYLCNVPTGQCECDDPGVPEVRTRNNTCH